MLSGSLAKVAAVAAAGSALLLAAHPGGAIVLPFVQEVPIPASALSGPNGDPALANFRCYDLMITISEGDQFLVAGMVSTLLPGQFYSPPAGGLTPGLTPGALEYDTYLTIPLFNPANPTNPFFAAPGRYTPNPGPPIMPRFGEQTNQIDITWGALGGSGTAGTYTIARLTITNDATGELEGEIRTRVFLNNGVPFDTSFFYGTQFVDGQLRPIVIPEPATAALVLPALVGLWRRRRR